MAQEMKMDMAQAVKMGVKLPLHAIAAGALKANQEAVINGKDLTFEDPQAWKFNGETAEFIGGNPNNGGTYDVTQLQKGMTYEVNYYVSMNNHQVVGPVTLTLQLPNGTQQKRTETITVNPGEWQAVFGGKFQHRFSAGDINFSFSAKSGDTWKGLLIQCVIIAPPF